MTIDAFFERPDVAALIEQARVAASMPVSVHAHSNEGEDARVAGSGSCSVCRLANSSEEGIAACRDSRGTAAAQALNRNRSVPVTCHLGLSCVAAPCVADSNVRSAITFGPFCPAEAPRGLEAIVAERLDAIAIDERPNLDDIARVSADGVPILVEWTVDRLTALWQEVAGEEASGAEIEEQDVPPPPPIPVKSRARIPGPAPIIALALAAGDCDSARWFLRNALEEAATLHAGGAQARAMSLVSQVLEAADHARLPTQQAWDHFDEFVTAGRSTRDIAVLSRACMRVFRFVANACEGQTADRLAIVFGDVIAEYGEGILLDDVASKTGTDPTAITHLLQRRFGLNFSELVGKVRIERAKRLLRDSRLSIVEIARRVGVSDPSNFGRLFRKFEGIAPLHYRERFRRAA